MFVDHVAQLPKGMGFPNGVIFFDHHVFKENARVKKSLEPYYIIILLLVSFDDCCVVTLSGCQRKNWYHYLFQNPPTRENALNFSCDQDNCFHPIFVTMTQTIMMML